MLNQYGEILFRASMAGTLMTEPLRKSETLSETTKNYLTEVFINEKYGRKKDVENKYIKKGLAVEEDAITLYSRVTKTFFLKNELRINSDYICGTPDIFIGDDILSATEIIDIKSSWDIFTFYGAKTKPLNQNYYWQLQCYMALTGATSARLAYCLVDTPQGILFDELSRLRWKMGVVNPETDENYKSACEELERLARYDDIPMPERVYEVVIKRNDTDIERLYSRIKECRLFLAEKYGSVENVPEKES